MHDYKLTIKVNLNRDDLIRIIAQQLTMSFRGIPTNGEECLKRVDDYLRDLIEGELKTLLNLENEFEETPKKPTDLEAFMKRHWAERKFDGPKFRQTATEIVEKCFPKPKPPTKKGKKS